jgi:homoserine O-acetyltransferase
LVHIDPALFEENERTAPAADGRRIVGVGNLHTETGHDLVDVEIAVETWGELNAAGDNAVLACHALSGDSHAIGWWDRVIGPGKAIDTDRFFVIGTNCLGGCQGSTGPGSRDSDGKRLGSRFPMITVGDMVEAQARVLDALGVSRLAMVAGGSMGGMQALEWAVRFPERVARCWMTASCHAHSAMQIGFNEAARQAILRDPRWMGGDFSADAPPAQGLSVARMIGHLSYLSEASFQNKFGRGLQNKELLEYLPGVEYQVESYLSYQGDKFTTRFDAGSLVVLSKAIDWFERTDLSPASCEFLFTSFTSDWLYPSHQSATLHEMAVAAGKRSRWVEIDLPYGHDAFLLDGEQQGALVREFLG